jgi:hypothetical protein
MTKKSFARRNAAAPMTAEQTALLKQLARDAHEPEAFSAQLTRRSPAADHNPRRQT